MIHHGLVLDEHLVGTGKGDYAAFVGRMSATKGVHTAIQIARQPASP